MKKIFAKKNRIICFFWTLIGIILLILIYQFKDTSLQETIGNIVIFYQEIDSPKQGRCDAYAPHLP